MSKLDKYKRNRVEKLEAIPTGVSIERRHKVFIDSNGLNLSAIVRDAIDSLMQGDESPDSARKAIKDFLPWFREFIGSQAFKEINAREFKALTKIVEGQSNGQD